MVEYYYNKTTGLRNTAKVSHKRAMEKYTEGRKMKIKAYDSHIERIKELEMMVDKLQVAVNVL